MIPQKTVSLIMILLTPFFVAGLITAWLRYNDLAKRYEILKREADALAKDNQLLEKSLGFVSLDAVKEFEVRQRLNLVKPGEKLVIFISPSPQPQTTTTESFLEKLKNWFKRD